MQRATFVYFSRKTRAAAEAALEECFATGEVSECEIANLKCEGGRWVLRLWA